MGRRVWALIMLSASMMACTAEHGLTGPSPVIMPDSSTIRVGASQTFVVFNASVVQFSLRSEGRPWNECVHVGAFPQGASITVIADAPCNGLVYLTADLGSGRSPVVAAITTQ